jgi:hypothetical protein
MLAWEQEETKPDSRAESESGFELFSKELLNILDEILAFDGEMDKPEREDWVER